MHRRKTQVSCVKCGRTQDCRQSKSPARQNERLSYMNPTIAALDNRTAIRVLNTVTSNALEPAPPPLDPEVFAALKQEHAADAASSVTEGDLARAALELLAENPELEQQIVALAAHPPAEQFDFG